MLLYLINYKIRGPMAFHPDVRSIIEKFYPGKNGYIVDGFTISNVTYERIRLLTTKKDSISVYTDGYIHGDISQPYKQLFILDPDGNSVIIYYTGESVYICTNFGKVRLIDDTHGAIKDECIHNVGSNPVHTFMSDAATRQIATFQLHPSFSQRTYYGKGASYLLPVPDQVKERVSIGSTTIVFTKSGSIYMKV